MKMNRIDETITVSPQISAGDVAAIADAGYRSILCNRPDGEAADQPEFAGVEAEAQKHGLAFQYQPVSSKGMTEADIVEFAKATAELPAPVFAYCRSGTRCTVLWSLSQLGKRDVSEIQSMTHAAGYDMSKMLARFANG